MVGHGRSNASSYLANPTSPMPSHCASIVVTSTLRVKQFIMRNNDDDGNERASSCVVALLLAPLTTSAQRSWWYYWFVRRPSVNFCFKSLLLLQFLFDHSEFLAPLTTSAQQSWWYYWFVRRPSSVIRPSTFALNRYSSYSSYSIILNFLQEKLAI